MKAINFYNSSVSIKFANMFNRFVLLVIVIMSACSNANTSMIEAEDFHALMVNEKPQVLDCRSLKSYDQGHIPGAVHIDVNQTTSKATIDALYKDVPVYFYGEPSACDKLKNTLMQQGIKQVIQIAGGYEQWLSARYEVSSTPVVKLYANDTIPFAKAIKGDKLVLVDFNATWCKPCRMMQPSIDKIREQRPDDVIVYSIDIDKEPEYNALYQISNIPLVLMFKQGKQLHRSEGYLEEAVLQNLVDINQ